MKRGKIKTIAFVLIIAIIAIIFIFYFVKQPKTGVSSEQKNVDIINTEPKYSVVKEQVNYYANTNGFLAEPGEIGNYPGVVMIHEWWGLNENIRQMAENLAAQGYIILAVDLYNGEVATKSSQAGQLAGSVRNNPKEAVENMKAAVSYLKERKGVSKVASLGWCFGGQQSLQISLNEDIDATVIYYGSLVTDKEQLASIGNPILGIFGAEDNSIPIATINEFDRALDELNIENEIYIYDNVGHAFANPSGSNYAQEETKDAWIKTLSFLERSLKG